MIQGPKRRDVAATELAEPVSLGRAPGRRLARLSLGHLIMIVAGLLAVATNLALLRSVDERVLVAVVGRDIRSGSVITSQDLRLTGVAADVAILDLLVTEAEASELAGVAVRDLRAGDLVLQSDVAPSAAPDGRRAMSIPIDPQHAVGGDIATGDRVDVVAVREGIASFVLVDVEVLAVAGAGAGPLGANRDFFVTVAVSDHQALELAEALETASLEVVLSTGAEPPSARPEG